MSRGGGIPVWRPSIGAASAVLALALVLWILIDAAASLLELLL